MMGLGGIAQAIMSGVGDQNAPPPQQPSPGPMPVPQPQDQQQGAPVVAQSGGQQGGSQAGPQGQNLLISSIMMAHAQMQSDGYAQQGAKALAEGESNAKPITIKTTIDPQTGKALHDIKNFSTGGTTPEEVNQGADQILANGVKAALTIAGTRMQPGDPKFSNGSFSSGYAGSRELGGSVKQAIIDGIEVATGHISPHSLQTQVDRHRAQVIQADTKAALPITGAARQEEVMKRQAQSFAASQDAYTKNLTTPEYAMRFASPTSTTDPTAAAADKQMYLTSVSDSLKGFGKDFTPELQKEASNVFDKAISMTTAEKQQARYTLLHSRMTPADVAFEPDPQKYLAEVENPGNKFTPQEKLTGLNMFNTAKRAWVNADEKVRQQIQNEKTKNELDRMKLVQNSQMASAAATISDPKTMTGLIDKINQNGDLYYTPAIQKNPYVKAAVDAALQFAPPEKLSSSQADRKGFALTGLNTLGEMNTLLSDARTKYGVELTGPALGRLNEKEVQFGAPAPDVVKKLLFQQNPNLTTEQLDKLTTMQTELRTKANYLAVVESKATTGSGRVAYEMFKEFQRNSVNPNANRPIWDGQSNAMGGHMHNIINTIEHERRGLPQGAPLPGAKAPAAGTTGGNVISLDDALAHIGKGKH